jgi:riboflavin kinase/FMN adenylyltransferase
MNVIRSLDGLVPQPSVVTVGTFDGVHRAHHEILAAVQREASARNARTAVVTFDPHPQQVVRSHTGDVRLLSTIDERIALLEAQEIDVVVVIAFTREFSETPPERFVEDVLVKKLGAVCVVVGHDHGFGRGRAGDLELLEQLGVASTFSVVPLDALIVDGSPVSSTRIRRALDAGDVVEAAHLLGHPYLLHGVVVPGDQRGRTIGVPTANIAPSSTAKLIPAPGVYAVRVNVAGSIFGGMMNIGTRPTVVEHGAQTIEAHLFGFDGDLYGTKVAVAFIGRIRDEKKFASMDALKEQLAHDSADAHRVLAIDGVPVTAARR